MFRFMKVRKHHKILKKMIAQNKRVEILRIAEKEYNVSYYTDKLINAEVELAELEADRAEAAGDLGFID